LYNELENYKSDRDELSSNSIKIDINENNSIVQNEMISGVNSIEKNTKVASKLNRIKENKPTISPDE